MNLKFSRYFVVLFLLLSVLMISSHYVYGMCYVKGLDCDPENLGYGSVSYSNIPDNTCFPGDLSNDNTGMAAECIQGCCCNILVNGIRSGVPMLDGACNNAYPFVPGLVAGTNGCVNICKTAGTVQKYNITGTVLIDGIPTPGATVNLNTLTATTNSTGGYTFANVDSNAYYSINAQINGCSNTIPQFYLSSNTQKDITIQCSRYNISGTVVRSIDGSLVEGSNVSTNTGLSMITESDGKYNFTGIIKGTSLTITANDSGCIGYINVNIENSNQENKDIIISCSTWNISGTVKDEYGIPVEKAVVNTNVKSGPDSSDTTSYDGVYELKYIPATYSGSKLTVRASMPTQQITAETTKTCSGEVSNVILNSNNENLDITVKCCTESCIVDSTCTNNQRNRRCTYEGSGCTKTGTEITKISCSSLSACGWTCDGWQPVGPNNKCPSGVFTQTQTCTRTPSTTSAPCDPNIPAEKPAEIRDCNVGCGDGTLNSTGGEECDYNQFTGTFITTANSACMTNWTHADITWANLQAAQYYMDPVKAKMICNFNNCSCIRREPEPPAVPTCNLDPKNISNFNISSIPMTKAFRLRWSMQNESCADFIEKFELRICDNTTGDCDTPETDVDRNIGRTNRSFVHNNTVALPRTQYCYQLTVIYNDSVVHPLGEKRKASNITCITSGDEECMGTHNDNFCKSNNVMNCSAKNNTLELEKDCSAQEYGYNVVGYCGVIDGVADCREQAPCELCNGFFGLFSYQGYRLPVEFTVASETVTKTVFCPSLQDPAPNSDNPAEDEIFGCYMDYSSTTIDKAYRCSDVKSCYNYLSESSCTQDYCGIFGTSPCEWANYTNNGLTSNTFKKGVCRPKNESQQNCGACGVDDTRRLYSSCTADICNLYGKCYFESVSGTCMNFWDVECGNYSTYQDCTGDRNAHTYVEWSQDLTQLGKVRKYYKVDGNNTLDQSFDYVSLGVCKWISDDYYMTEFRSKRCVRDADSNYEGMSGSGLNDCIFPRTITNPTDKVLKSMCEKDNQPPNTTIETQPRYGAIINLDGKINVADKLNTRGENSPWIVGDDTYGSTNRKVHMITHYCVVSEFGICYPNLTMTVAEANNKYKINLLELSNGTPGILISENDSNRNFTLFYFSEDAAKNLELIKNFTFNLDSRKPNVSVNFSMYSFRISKAQWLTNLNATLTLNEDDTSGAVECSFKLKPVGDDKLFVLSFGNKRLFNIPVTPNDKWLNIAGNTLKTSYPSLSDGDYEYELICIDGSYNILNITQPLKIEGDLAITNPKPHMETFRNATSTYKPFPGAISINTTSTGLCRYSNLSSVRYVDMTNNFNPFNNNKFHNTTVTIPTNESGSYISGIYKYYVACNLSINQQYEVITGDVLDMPIFAIDELPPKTDLVYRINNNPLVVYTTSVPVLNKITFALNCSDDNAALRDSVGGSMAFGCNNTMYYCIPELNNNEDNCNPQIPSSFYQITPEDRPELDYTDGGANKQKYGNNPIVYFYSKDNGNNTEEVKSMKLLLKDTTFVNPTITFEPEAPANTVVLGDPTTIIVNYTSETNVKIESFALFKNNGGALQYIDTILDGEELQGKSVYRFRREYLPNGNYVIKINATDDDDNNNTFQTTFVVNHGPATVGLVSPIMGVGQTSNYNIILETSTSSVCKYNVGNSDLTACDTKVNPLSCKFNDYDTTITNRDASNKIHTITYGGTEGLMYVVCKLDYGIGDGDDSYASTVFHVGIVNSAPEINITYIQTPFTNLSDNIIINPDYLSTKLQVLTNHLSICKIESIDAPKNLLEINSYFNGEVDKFDYMSYNRVHNFTINYTGTQTYDGTFKYKINCTNLAQYSNESNATITIALDYTPPEVNLVLIPEQSNLIKNVFRVNCTDHCTNTYWYKIVNTTATCEGTKSAYTSTKASSKSPVTYDYNITITNTSKVCLIGEDILGRQNATEEIVSVMKFNNGEMYFTQPPYIYTSGDTLHLYSENKTFELNLQTVFNATCKYAFAENVNIPEGTTNVPKYIYENYGIPFYNTSNNTYNTTNHTTNITLNSKDNVDEGIIIICEAMGTDDAHKYITRSVFAYWDNSSPIITYLYIPPRINDWNNRLNITVVVDTDDDTICTINDTKNEIYPYNEDFDVFDDYSKHHEYIYNLINIISATDLNNLDYTKNINLNVTCFNRAKLNSSKNGSTEYKLDKQVDITRISSDTFKGVTASTKIPIEVNTSIKADCTLYIDGANKGVLPTTNNINHKLLTTFPSSGIYSVRVDCEVSNKDGISGDSEEYSLYLDGRPPTLILTTSGKLIGNKYYSCNLDSFTVSLNMEDDTGVIGYNYSIFAGTSKLINGVFTSSGNTGTITYPSSGSLEDGKTYKVQAKAIDRVNNSGTLESIEIVAASPETGVACDNTNPVVTINTEKKYNYTSTGVDNFAVVNITCVDPTGTGSSKSECTDTFYYSFIVNSNSCSGANYELIGKYTKKIFIQNNGTLCVKGYDNANNPGLDAETFSITKMDCGNGIIETKPTVAEIGLSSSAFNNWDSTASSAYNTLSSETCDGSVPEGKSCFTEGFIGGTLNCNTQECQLVTTDCDDGMDVNLINPWPFGIGNTSTYDLNVTSQYNATCRYGITSGSNVVTAYSLLTRSMSPISETDLTQHNLTITTTNAGPKYLPRTVLCNATSQVGLSNPNAAYGILRVYEGYDSSIPSIIVTTSRVNNTVNDFNSREIDIIVKTDDYSVCELSDDIGIYDGVFMISADNYADVYDVYATNHQKTIDYSAVFGADTITDITYNITCYNRAGLSNKTSITVHYNITKGIIITKITPVNDFSTSTSATYRIKTNLLTSCSINNGTTTQLMSGSQPMDTEHEQTIKILNGENIITITCNNGIQALPVTATYNIYGGANGPINMQIQTNSLTCSLSAITANLSAVATTRAIARYNYTIIDLTDNVQLTSDTTTTGQINYIPAGGVIDGHIYKISAYAIDTLGQISTIDNELVIGTSPSAKECDYSSPTLTITQATQVHLDIAQVQVSCTDGQSGCANKYYYRIIGSDASCNSTTYSTYRSYTENLTITQSGKLCVKGLDKNNNAGYAEKTISLSNNNDINITPISPPNIILPRTIITTTPVTNISLTTGINADCRYSQNTPTNVALATLYDRSTPLTVTGGTQHNLIGFNTNGIYRQYMNIVCKSNLATNPYSSMTIEIIYMNESSIPKLTVTANPSMVIDWNERQTEFNITTDTDTICTITSTNDNAHSLIRLGNSNDATTYVKSRYETIAYDAATVYPNTFTYDVTCTNFIGKSNTTSVIVIYNISDTFTVDILSSEYFAGTTADITARTNLLGICQLYVDDVLSGSMSTSQSKAHFKRVTGLTSGAHELRVTCNTEMRGLTAEDTQSIMTGTSAPVNMQIVSDSLTCNLNTITATLTATRTVLPIARYNYTIIYVATGATMKSDISTTGTISYAPNGGIVDGNDYKIEAYAIDTAGYASTKATKIVTGSSPGAKECDHTPPTITITETPTGFLDVTTIGVSCDDGTGSNCTNKYYYGIINFNEACNSTATYSRYRSYADVLTVRESGKLCVKGLDKNNNAGYAEKNISLITNNSMNIQLIPPPSIIQPNVLVTTTPITNISVNTETSANCRYSQNTPGNAPLSQVYSSSTPFTNTGATQHQITGFNTNSVYRQYVNIVCNATGMSSTSTPYSSVTIEVIYINTSILPTITASANPAMVFDWNDRTTELNITTDIDTVCTIVSPTDTDRPTIYSGDASNALTYAKHHYETIEYDTSTVSPSLHTYNINCRNLANIGNNASVNVTYNLSDTFTVEMTSPSAFRVGVIDVVAKTNLLGMCKLYQNGTSKGDMSTVPTRNHLMRLVGLVNGTYSIEFRCITLYRPLETNATYTVIINSSLPDPNAVRCGDGIINQAAGIEECDGNALNGKTCKTGWIQTNYTGGVLKCGLPGTANACKYDKSSCDDGKGYCGDNKVQGPNTQNVYEQCDGSIPRNLDCEDFGFKYGSLSCNNCRINTSRCSHVSGGLGTLGTGAYSCRVNNQLDSGEQCEVAGIYGISCESFGYDGGTVSCSNCDYVLTGCYFDAEEDSRSSSCNNNNKREGSEQCDGTDGLSTVSCRLLGNFTGGNVSCTRSCKYDTSKCIKTPTNTTTNTTQTLCSNGKKDIAESDVDCGGSCPACAVSKSCFTNNDCGSKKCVSSKCVADTCNNSRYDNGTESDIDCGKTCKSCAVGKNCSSSADCTSKICTAGRCSSDPCSNGIKDEGEGDIDCGGNCDSCQVGNTCSTNSDCGTNSCIENTCTEPVPPVNPLKLPLLIIGMVFILGGGGYIAYKTFIDKPKGGFGTSQMSMPPPVIHTGPTKLTPEQEEMIKRQREAMLKKRQGRMEQRKGVLQQLEESLTGEKHDEEKDKDELKALASKSASKDKSSSKELETDSEGFVDLSKAKSKKEKESSFDKLKEINKGTEGSAFDKLKTLKVDEVSKKISEISGASQEYIKPKLQGREELHYSDAMRMFGNIDRDMIMSGVFREILSKLLDSGKITKQHVSNILFEYMDKGVITKSDVAKITSELKII